MKYTIKKTNPEGTKTRWVAQRMSKSNQPIGKAEIFSTEEAAKRFVASKSEVKESTMSSIMKGILSESGEPVSVIYIDGKASVKYTNKADAEEAKALMMKKHPKKNIEIKSEMREASNTMQRYGQQILKRAKAQREAEYGAAKKAEQDAESKKEEPNKGKWASKSYKTADGKWASKDVKEEAEQVDEAGRGSGVMRLVKSLDGVEKAFKPYDTIAMDKWKNSTQKPDKPAKLASIKKPTSDEIWRQVERVVSDIFPDGDPYDHLMPYLRKHKLDDVDITRAARKNGYKDLSDYWNTVSQDTENDAYADWHATGGKEVRVRNPRFKGQEDKIQDESSIMKGLTR